VGEGRSLRRYHRRCRIRKGEEVPEEAEKFNVTSQKVRNMPKPFLVFLKAKDNRRKGENGLECNSAEKGRNRF